MQTTEQLKPHQSIYDRFPQLRGIAKDRFPKHICFIADGNGRWAEREGVSVRTGHQQGARALQRILDDLVELKEVPIVSVWGFSVDNRKRGKEEVNGLMDVFATTLSQTIGKIIQAKARFIHLGRKDLMPAALRLLLDSAEEQTATNTQKIIAAAIDFGGDDQELRIIEKIRRLPPEISTTQELIESLRDGGGAIPPADLLIRTSGEHRTSGIGWLNGPQTELRFEDKLFPDLTTADVIDALVDFSQRERRLGGRRPTGVNAS